MARQPPRKAGTSRPLLLVDVDGVLSLFGGARSAPETLVATLVDGVPHLLSRTAAEALGELVPAFECVWCTGWKDRADAYLPHLLGLPRGWPHVRFADVPGHGGHWKLGGIEAFAGPARALAWIDAHLDADCHAWAAARPGPTLLLQTDPEVGLTRAHARRARAWVDAITGSSCSACR
jgi:hypothetical protein